MKILIADDDRLTRLILNAFLSESGHSILEAKNGKEAIDAFDHEKPDLILMDSIMPVISGYDAAAIIKQRTGNYFIPIIFLTSLSDDESLAKCIESGGDDFLVKPVNKVLLEAKITAMQRIRAMSQELEHYKRRTEEEIKLAHHVFDSLTKRMSTQVVPELDYWLRSAGHFSGDLMIYDKSPIGKLYLLLGDFTGHGFSAAIGALPTSDIFFAMTRRNFNGEDILAEINRKLQEIMPTSHFCATAFICFDPLTRQIEIFNGGLPPVLILDAEGHIKTSVKSSNLPLGIMPAELFNIEISTFENFYNATVIIYSDGLIEAQNNVGEMFGDERLYDAFRTGKKAFGATKALLEEFIGDSPLGDDISLVSLSF